MAALTEEEADAILGLQARQREVERAMEPVSAGWRRLFARIEARLGLAEGAFARGEVAVRDGKVVPVEPDGDG